MTVSLVSHISTELYTHVHVMDIDIHVFDTDCYGVMWHGAYAKWMEIGRVKLLEEKGFVFSMPGDPEGIIFPVTSQQYTFKAPASYGKPLCLTTKLAVQRYKLHFLQVFTDKQTAQIVMEASTTVVTLNANWKVNRKLPESLHTVLTHQSP
jgi:acyl-CoA thioester hydrolase